MPDTPRTPDHAAPASPAEAASATPSPAVPQAEPAEQDAQAAVPRPREPGPDAPTVFHTPVDVPAGDAAPRPARGPARPATAWAPRPVPGGMPATTAPPGRFGPGRPGTRPGRPGPLPGRPPGPGAVRPGAPPMPPRPVQRPLVPPAAAAPAAVAAPDDDAVTTATPAPAKAAELTLNKVVAGAGAAATSAVVGSYLGATGTVVAAALGSVVSMVGASVYQRSLDRTRDTVKAKIRLPGGDTVEVDGPVQVPAQRTAADVAAPTELLVAPATPPADRTTAAPAVSPVTSASRRPWVAMALGVVLAFAIGMLAVTGVEWVKGSPLSSSDTDRGTSVGRVLGGGGDSTSTEPAPTEEQSSDDDSSGSDATRSAEPTADPRSESARPPGFSATPEPSATTTRPAPSSTSTAPSAAPSTTAVAPLLDAPQGG